MNNAKGEENEEKGEHLFHHGAADDDRLYRSHLYAVRTVLQTYPLLFGANEGSLPMVMRYAK